MGALDTLRPVRLLLLAGLPLTAQELFIAPSEFLVSTGQRVAALVSGADSSPGRLRDAALYTPKGVYNVVNLRSDGGAVTGDAAIPSAGTLALAIRSSPEVVSRVRRSSCAKALLVSEPPDEHFRRAAGLPLEFVPDADPYRLKPGHRLPLRLLLRGAPAAGLEVLLARAGGEPRRAGRADSVGWIFVQIPSPGVWRLTATVRQRCAEPHVAEWESISTSLTFWVPEENERQAP